MKNKYIRLKALLLAGTMFLSSPILTSCKEDTSNQTVISEEITTNFDIGEHIISIPISKDIDIRNCNVQYDYHPGYEPIGISSSAYGKFDNNFGGGAILYSNIEEVKCSSNIIDKNGNYVYLNFGTPIVNIETNEKKEKVKTFNEGEHIISIPLDDDNRENQFQYDYHEGYEVVGISASSHGMFENNFGGGVILYKNIVPVQCYLEDDSYTTFGQPIQKEKVKVLN